jgi:transposase
VQCRPARQRTIGFTTNAGKFYLPVIETKIVHTHFPYFQKHKVDLNREYRGTVQLLRKGPNWYVAIPVETSCEMKSVSDPAKTPIGVDLGLHQLAVVSEPASFFQASMSAICVAAFVPCAVL